MSSDATPNLGLPYLDPSQAQPEVKINAAWDILDGMALDITETGESPNVGISNVKEMSFAGASVFEESNGKAIVTINYGQIPPVTWSNDLSAISTPINVVLRFVTSRFKIRRATLLTAGGPGSCTVYVWRLNLSHGFPPTSGDDITGGNNLVISSGETLDDDTLSGWDTQLEPGDVLLFTLDANSTFSTVQVVLTIG
jgi:hypothetical protein